MCRIDELFAHIVHSGRCDSGSWKKTNSTRHGIIYVVSDAGAADAGRCVAVWSHRRLHVHGGWRHGDADGDWRLAVVRHVDASDRCAEDVDRRSVDVVVECWRSDATRHWRNSAAGRPTRRGSVPDGAVLPAVQNHRTGRPGLRTRQVRERAAQGLALGHRVRQGRCSP